MKRTAIAIAIQLAIIAAAVTACGGGDDSVTSVTIQQLPSSIEVVPQGSVASEQGLSRTASHP